MSDWRTRLDGLPDLGALREPAHLRDRELQSDLLELARVRMVDWPRQLSNLDGPTMDDWPNTPVPQVTSLPSSAYDGQEVVYEADATNGVMWRLKYNAGSSSTHKWECIGGPPLEAHVDTGQTTTSTTYVALTTAGPSITVPLAGDYIIQVVCNSLVSAVAQVYHSYDVGATGAIDADAGVVTFTASSLGASSQTMTRRKNGLAASTAIVSKYKTTGGTATIQNRVIFIYPVRHS